MTEMQERLLQNLKAFNRFCEENNLMYYAAYGTCLGAVRHHGFIPWDDDMDVYMLRADYERFLAIREKLRGTSYWIMEVRDGYYPHPFAKFYSTDASIWEQRKFHTIIGPWIDVFPIDEWDENEYNNRLYDEYISAFLKYRKAISYESWNEIWYNFVHFNVLNTLVKLIKKCFFFPFKEFYLKCVLEEVDKVQKVHGEYYRHWGFLFGRGKIYQKDWFKGRCEFPFEDTYIMCPNGYEEMLTLEYGDYMTFPPEEERKGAHPCFYIDLENKKSKKDILEEMKISGVDIYYEENPISFKSIILGLIHKKW